MLNSRYACIVLLIACGACQPRVNVDAERSALERTDKEWAEAASAGKDVDRIVGYWSDDATVFPAGMPVVQGKAALRTYVEASLKVPGFSIDWKPEHVTVSPDGNLGYTTGTNTVTVSGPKGNTLTMPGRYVGVWRRGPDGTWKCVIDIWNSGAPS